MLRLVGYVMAGLEASTEFKSSPLVVAPASAASVDGSRETGGTIGVWGEGGGA